MFELYALLVVEILLVKLYRRNEEHRGAICICEKIK
jgi:hypothetical protein